MIPAGRPLHEHPDEDHLTVHQSFLESKQFVKRLKESLVKFFSLLTFKPFYEVIPHIFAFLYYFWAQ